MSFARLALLLIAPLQTQQGGDAQDPYLLGRGQPGLDARHYELHFLLAPPATDVRALARLQLSFDRDMEEIALDFHDALRTRQVLVDGEPAAFVHEEGKLRVPRPTSAGDSVELTVLYAGNLPSAQSQGEPVGLLSDGFSLVAYLEPDGAHHFYPCNDVPSDKATFDLHVAVPPGHFVGASGRLAGAGIAAGLTRYHWRSDRPMATYLLSLAAGPFRVIQRAGPIPILDLAWPDDADEVRESLAAVGPMLEFLEARFGAYPFARYGHVFTNLPVGGMENQTQTVLGRAAGLASDPDLLVHEAAHQWFGNWVSPRTWQDLWLNEGWASYAELLWAEESEGERLARRRLRFWRRAALRAARQESPWTLERPDPANLFGVLIYGKGPMVLHLLAEYVGRERFYAAARAYLAEYGGGNASTADMQRVFSESCGIDLGPFFDGWVRGNELPRVQVGLESRPDGEEWSATIRLRQVQDGPVLPFAATVRLSNGKHRQEVAVRCTARETTLEARVPFEPREAVLDPRQELPVLSAP